MATHNVGWRLADALHRGGAALVLADIDIERGNCVASEFHAEIVEPDAIFSMEADIFAPCVLGEIINDYTIPRLRAIIVAGAANNQTLESRHGEELKARNKLYAPDGCQIRP